MSLSDSELREQRDQAMAGVVRGLYVMNGGGSVALLALAQALVPLRLDLVTPVIVGLIPLAMGLTAAVFVHFFRYHTSYKRQAGENSWERYRWLYLSASCVSAALFSIGALIVAIGILCRL